MTAMNLLVLVAVASSALLMLRRHAYAVVALIASGVQALIAFNILTLAIRGVSLSLILGGVVAGVGVYSYTRVRGRAAVSAATLLILIGGLWVLTSLGVV